MAMRLYIIGLFSVAAVLTLTGCSETASSSRSLSTPSYLFYATLDGTSRFGLRAVDPDVPTTPITIAADGSLNSVLPSYFMAGKISGSTISDLHYRYVVYGNGTGAGTGNLYRLGARKEDGLFPARVSNESAAFDICQDLGIFGFGATAGATASYPDYVNPLNSVYVYLKDTGGVANCETPFLSPPNGSPTAVPRVVRLGMTDAVAPFTTTAANAQYPVAPVYNANGSLNSLLFWTSNGGGNLTRHTIAAGLPRTLLLTGVTEIPRVLGIGPQGHVLLLINGNSVRSFNPATLTLSASLFNSPGISTFTATDDQYLYFRVNKIIRRVPYSATNAAEVSLVVDESATPGAIEAGWYTGFSAFYVQDMVISRGRLVYSFHDTTGGMTHIRSAPVSGGSANTLYSYPTSNLAGRTGMYRIKAAAGRIYLSHEDPVVAVSVADTGGSQVVYPNSRWVGFTYHPSTQLFGDFDKAGSNMRAKSMFLIEYDAINGDRLSSYDADTTAKLVDFGVVAPMYSSYLLTALPDILGVTTSERTLFAYNNIDGYTDVLYLHARDGSSARQLTYNDQTGKMLVGMNNVNGGCVLGPKNGFDPVLLLLAILSVLQIWRRRMSRKTPG